MFLKRMFSSSVRSLHPSLHHPAARAWTEPVLSSSQLVYPLFVTDKVEDKSLTGFEPNFQWGNKNNYQSLLKHLEQLHKNDGLNSVMLFGVVKSKTTDAAHALSPQTPVLEVTRLIRQHLPGLMILSDVCLCAYTDHGHCGFLKDDPSHSHDDPEQIIDNEKTIDFLGDVAVEYARAGAHWVCPSDMMDGRIRIIRSKLDANGFRHVGIMAYTSKKASVMYSPFRNAVDSNFKGNRKQYQHPVGSLTHALQALERDTNEGANVVLVKPALFYGDIIKEFSQRSNLPIAAYVVSGEYVMLKKYAEVSGDEATVIREAHISLIRAGANILITYYTPQLLKMISNSK